MKPTRGRVQKVIAGLTPQKAVVQWLAEAHHHRSLTAFARWWTAQPGSLPPLSVVANRVELAVRQALRGADRDDAERAVQQAVRDTLFLMHVHHEVNVRVLDHEEQWRLERLLLAELLQSLLDQVLQRLHVADTRRLLSAQSYPLDPQTAAAVQAAQAHAVETWDSLDDAGTILDWVVDAYVQEGRTALPDGASAWLLDPNGTRFPWWERADEATLRALFPDAAAWDAFREQRDYQNGLLDVPDAEVAARVEAVTAAMQGLAARSGVQAGQVLRLPTVPLFFLEEVPLVDGVWVDRAVLALAEWGAELEARGYRLQQRDDDHPCAWPAITPPEGAADDAAALLAATWTRLERAPGRTRAIGDRPFVHLADYRRWRGRRLKALPRPAPGMVLASWNAWVTAHGGDGVAELAGVRVGSITGWAADLRATVLPDADARQQQAERRRLFAVLEAPGPPAGDDPAEAFDRLPARAVRWRDLAVLLLSELYATDEAATVLSRRYLGGAELYFPEERALLTEGTAHAERLVAHFNRVIAPDVEATRRVLNAGEGGEQSSAPLRIDLVALRRSRTEHTAFVVRSLVDHSRAKTLDDVGRGNEAQEIMLRYLHPEP